MRNDDLSWIPILHERALFTGLRYAVSGGLGDRLCSLCRSRDFDGARTALYLIPVGTDMVLVLLVAGFFLLADLLLVLLFAAQSNLAFLGMWIELTRPDLAELLPFDADAGSSSNMVSP